MVDFLFNTDLGRFIISVVGVLAFYPIYRLVQSIDEMTSMSKK